MVYDLRTGLLVEQLESARASASDAREAAEHARRAAGQTADAELGRAYDKYGRSEQTSANWFRVGAVATLVIAAGVSLVGVYGDTPDSTAAAITHITAVVSVLALFGYLARESAQHRNTARWAAVMVVQLKTFDSYAADMSNQEREALRAYFGRRVFSELPGASNASSDRQEELTPSALLALRDIVEANKTK